jgi:hypothetical protein
MSNGSQPHPPVLFYSPKCQYSQQLIGMIQKNQPLAKTIQPVDVHQVDPKKLPRNLEEIPAILVNNNLLVGDDTFKWVQFQNTSQEKKTEQSPGPPGPPGNQQMPGDFLPFDTELGGNNSINYTSFDDQKPMENSNFYSFDKHQTNGSDGVDMEAATDPSMISKQRGDETKQQYEQLQKIREMGGSKQGGQPHPERDGYMNAYQNQSNQPNQQNQQNQQKQYEDALPKRW